MKNLILIIIMLLVLLMISLGCSSKKIADTQRTADTSGLVVPSDMKEYIRYLQFGNAEEKVNSAYQLGIREPLAYNAVPYLINILDDPRLEWRTEMEETRIMDESGKLVSVGQNIVSYPTTVQAEAFNALKLITGKDFGTYPDPWIDWWNARSQ